MLKTLVSGPTAPGDRRRRWLLVMIVLDQNSMIALDRYLPLISKTRTRRDRSGGGVGEHIALTGRR
jgi:hypothetical protein